MDPHEKKAGLRIAKLGRVENVAALLEEYRGHPKDNPFCVGTGESQDVFVFVALRRRGQCMGNAICVHFGIKYRTAQSCSVPCRDQVYGAN